MNSYEEQIRASLKELERLQLAERKANAAEDLLSWVLLTSGPGYHAGWVHRDICRRLQRFSKQVTAKQSPRLIIAMPPRAGKTHIVSQRWPVWHMARNPGHEIICASYAAELAEDNSREARDVARSEEARDVFTNIMPEVPKRRHDTDYRRPELDRIAHWRIGNKASYKAVGVGGALTGRGGHLAIVDDPFKGRAEADSATIRRRAWEWYTSTLYTRLAPGGGIVVMATRWHDDDLTGRLLQEMEKGTGDTWEIVSYPAIAEVDEEHRKAGEPLHPERFDLDALMRIKAALGTREWEALYQQRPIPEGGGRIKEEWFEERYMDRPEKIAAEADEVWATVDAAKKGGEDNDYHAIHVWARFNDTGKKYLLDRRCERVGYPGFERILDNILNKWQYPLRMKGGALIEDTANGTTYLQIHGGSRFGVPLIPFHPNKDTPGTDKSKHARATYLERDAEAGNIILPDSRAAAWVDDVIAWWTAFPRGKNDDDVDAASQLLMRWAVRGDAVIDINQHLRFLMKLA